MWKIQGSQSQIMWKQVLESSTNGDLSNTPGRLRSVMCPRSSFSL